MNKLMRNEQGSSSILVIIMMVVLMVFALAILTTSLSNQRLGDKKRAWLQDYYTVEASVEEEIALIDDLLITAQELALNSLRTNSYVDDYMLDGLLSAKELEEFYVIIYNDFVTELILEHIAGDNEAFLVISDIEAEEVLMGKLPSPSLLTFTQTINQNNFPKHISVTLALKLPTKDNTNDLGYLHKRFGIEEYVQWQDAFEYDESFDFGDPFEEDAPSKEGSPSDDQGNPFEEKANPVNDNPF